MNDARALLDSLMGAGRDAKDGEKRKDEFRDPNVCKYMAVWHLKI